MTVNAKAKAIIDQAVSENRKFITEPEAKALLSAYGVPVTKEVVCHSAEEAAEAAGALGFPVVMKLVSPDVVHKTEANVVRLNVCNATRARSVFKELTAAGKAIDARIMGVLVSETATGHEVIIGSLKDSQFGQLVMLGMGGITVEVYKDVAYRLAPVSRLDVTDMLAELRGSKVLEGFRGMEKADTTALKGIVCTVSKVVADFCQIQKMDLNPVFVGSKGAKVADARIHLD